jgi:hypothetical protein
LLWMTTLTDGTRAVWKVRSKVVYVNGEEFYVEWEVCKDSDCRVAEITKARAFLNWGPRIAFLMPFSCQCNIQLINKGNAGIEHNYILRSTFILLYVKL